MQEKGAKPNEINNQWRRWIAVVMLVGIFLLRLLLSPIEGQGSRQLHMLLEFAAGIIAVLSGVLALVRYSTGKSPTYLYLGIGFFGVGIIDGYHAVLTGIWTSPLVTALSEQNWFWLWNTSGFFLAVLIVGSFWMERVSGKSSAWEKILYWGLGSLLLALFIFLMLSPLPLTVENEAGIKRLMEVITAVLFLFGSIGFLGKDYWQGDGFEFSLLLSMVILAAANGLFLVFSQLPLDNFSTAGAWLKLLAYVVVLTGLINSIYFLFSRAEDLVVEQTRVNAALQKEIRERERAERAEQEQRKLAEALREVSIAFSSTLEIDQLLDLLLERILDVLPFDTANVMLVRGEEVEIVSTRGYGPLKAMQQPRRFLMSSIPSLRRMMESGRPLIIPDTNDHELWVNADTSPHVHSWAGAPIIVNQVVVAFLALNYSQPNMYQPEQAVRLSAFAAHAAIAFENANLYTELQKSVSELTTLNNISQAITSTLELEENLTIITRNITKLLEVDATSVILHDPEQEDLYFAAASGEAAEFVLGKRMALGQGVVGWVATHGEGVLVPDTALDNRYFSDFDAQSGFHAKSILCVPLIAKGEIIGAIEAINKMSRAFNEEDLRLLNRLAGPAATAIENAMLFEKSQQEIYERIRAEEALVSERAQLARRVEERTQDLQTANVELARAARMKDEFLASMSHELRTPLNAVLGISEALQDEVFGEMNTNQLKALRSIEESGRHLLELINDILDLSKVEAGKLELEMVPISVEGVCQASLRLVKQNAHKKRLRIGSSYDSAVSTLLADERRVKQILVNLLSNAVKFTPAGGQIGLDVIGDEINRLVHISIWDTGIGIADEDKKKLFQPFVQLDSRLSREYAGTGLGLSLVSRMMELHGGAVSVESEMGRGSRFTVTFPWHKPPQNQAEDEDEIDGILPISNVLLIEDSPAATAQIKRYLKEMQIEVAVFGKATNAVQMAAKVDPDLIILDIMLPDGSGWEVLAQLQAEPRTAQIPVMVATVIDAEYRALEAGASAFLLKPVVREQLFVMLRQISQHLTPELGHDGEPVVVKNGRAPRILLAEDNEANIQTFSSYLTAKGFVVDVARNGLDAISHTKTEKPDLIIMDIQMPHMSGLEAIEHIRKDADPAVRDVPIVAVTALAMPGDREICLEAGASDYLSKPVRLKTLIEAVQRHLLPPADGNGETE